MTCPAAVDVQVGWSRFSTDDRAKCGHRRAPWSILVVPHIFAGRPHFPRSLRRTFGGLTLYPELGSEVPMIATWRKHAACRGIDPDVFYPLPMRRLAQLKPSAMSARCVRPAWSTLWPIGSERVSGAVLPNGSGAGSTGSAASLPDPLSPRSGQRRRQRRGAHRPRCRQTRQWSLPGPGRTPPCRGRSGRSSPPRWIETSKIRHRMS